jgi:hypothetical protein
MPGDPRGHSRDHHANGDGPLLEQTSNGGGRNVAFDHVSVRLGGMTRNEVARNAKSCPDTLEIGFFPNRDAEPAASK